MHQLYQQEENILSRIISMLSMYHCLYLAQLCRLFPEVNNEQLTVLLRKLVRKGRLTLDSATGLVCYTGVKDADSATLSAVWLLGLLSGNHLPYHLRLSGYTLFFCVG